MQDGVVEASSDGATWFELGVARDPEVRVAAPRAFRWVRLRALSDQDSWLALRDVRAVR